MKHAALLALACCLCACSHNRRSTPESAMHWSALKEACDVGAERVTCDKGPFGRVMRGCIDTNRRLEYCREKLAACRSMTAVDRAECLGSLDKCQERLNNPWRNPWLWGVLMFVGGALAGLGAGLGAG